MPTHIQDDAARAYYHMLRIRIVEEAIANLYAEQQMRCPVHLSIGQEAVAAGVAMVAKREDYAMSGHRSHAHYLAKGGSLPKMMAELYGKSHGCCGGMGGSMHLIDEPAGFMGAVPIVGSTIPIAVGLAFATQQLKENRVVFAFFGEGATEEGVFHESLNFAALHRLPIVFVCENNLYSVYSPMRVRQPDNRSLTALAQAHGLISASGNGNDVGEVTSVLAQARHRAASGEGPSFVVFDTYRWREHCGPNFDNNIGYRTEAEFEAWKQKCPVQLWEKTHPELVLQRSELERRIRAEIDEAVTFAKNSPYPEPGDLQMSCFA